jgi:hypothetical protein
MLVERHDERSSAGSSLRTLAPKSRCTSSSWSRGSTTAPTLGPAATWPAEGGRLRSAAAGSAQRPRSPSRRPRTALPLGESLRRFSHWTACPVKCEEPAMMPAASFGVRAWGHVGDATPVTPFPLCSSVRFWGSRGHVCALPEQLLRPRGGALRCSSAGSPWPRAWIVVSLGVVGDAEASGSVLGAGGQGVGGGQPAGHGVVQPQWSAAGGDEVWFGVTPLVTHRVAVGEVTPDEVAMPLTPTMPSGRRGPGVRKGPYGLVAVRTVVGLTVHSCARAAMVLGGGGPRPRR